MSNVSTAHVKSDAIIFLNRLWNSFRGFIAKYYSECLEYVHNFIYYSISDFLRLSCIKKHTENYTSCKCDSCFMINYITLFGFFSSILSFVLSRWTERRCNCLLYWAISTRTCAKLRVFLSIENALQACLINFYDYSLCITNTRTTTQCWQ